MDQRLNIREKDGRIVEKIYDYEIWWPTMPPKRTIDGYSLPKSKQKFTRTQYPKSLYNPRRDDDGNIIYSLDEQSWVNRELERIVNGYWFYNNGQPTYITGYHYFELNYWQIDVGYKDYRDRDRRFHLVWQFCEDDPNCYGLIYMKHRREGATHRACAINYLTALFHPGVINGIQSKTSNDAKKVFQTKLVPAWRKLRPFLQPIFEGTTNPKQQLSFSEPAEKIGKNTKRVKSSNALDSVIMHAPSVDTAFDGDKVKFHHLDEAGKTVEMNVYDCWLVVKECLNNGGGKCLVTSTVEEMTKKGGANFKRIWQESDYMEKSEVGQTASGLYKLFFPSYDGLETDNVKFFDEYGYSLKEEAKHHLDSKLKHLRAHGDQEGINSFKRKYPQTEGDALLAAVSTCEFNLEKLESQREYLVNLPNNKKPYVVGNLIWENGQRDTRVVFQPNKNGRWKMAYRFPDESEQSNYVDIVTSTTDTIPETDISYDRYIYKPKNSDKFVLGVDPYNIDRTKTGKGSKGGGYVFKKFDLMEEKEEYNKIFAAQYLHRPPKAVDFYEDMIKTCMFFGCQMLFEDQKQRIKYYFEERKYHYFLMVSPLTEKKKAEKKQILNKMVDVGQSASREVTQQIGEKWEAYIEDCWDKIYFEELIEDLIEFDPYNTEKSDATMSSGYALIGADKFIRKRKTPKKEVKNLFPTYSHKGREAKIIQK